MKTVKTYMVRKPSDLDEVKSITRANSDRLETVAVVGYNKRRSSENKTGRGRRSLPQADDRRKGSLGQRWKFWLNDLQPSEPDSP